MLTMHVTPRHHRSEARFWHLQATPSTHSSLNDRHVLEAYRAFGMEAENRSRSIRSSVPGAGAFIAISELYKLDANGREL